MKRTLAFLFLASFCNANAETTYTTSVGATFTQVQSTQFGNAWMDPSGTVWSSYIGDFSNIPKGPLDKNTIVDSEAVLACKKLNSELPTLSDYLNLAIYFERNSSGVLITEKGRQDLNVLFPDLGKKAFWSSTLDAGSIFYPFYDYGVINCWMDSCKKMIKSVRCITRQN